jgi:hypothetical protein
MRTPCEGTGKKALASDKPGQPNLRICPVCGMWTIPFRNGRVRPHNDLRLERERKSG